MTNSLPALIVNRATITPLVLLMAVLLVAGCRRKKPEPSDAQSVSSLIAPATASPAPGVASQVDIGLQQVLVKFYNDNQRPAMSWEDLVGGKYISSIPLGPDGQPLDWNTTMQRIGKLSTRPRQ